MNKPKNFPQLLTFLESVQDYQEMIGIDLELLRRVADMTGYFPFGWKNQQLPFNIFDRRDYIIKALHEVLDEPSEVTA